MSDQNAKPQKKESIWSLLGVVVLALFIKAVFFTIFIIPSGSMIPTLKVGDVLFVNKMEYGVFNPFYELWFKEKVLFFIPNPFFKSGSPWIKTRYVWDFQKSPKRMDIVIFKAPLSPQPTANYTFSIDNNKYDYYFHIPGKAGMDYVKRCVGIPGDVIEIRNGKLLVNNDVVTYNYTWYLDCNEQNCSNYKKYGVRCNSYSSYWWGPIKVPIGHYFMLGDNRPHSSDGRDWGFVPESHLVGRATWVALPPWNWTILK